MYKKNIKKKRLENIPETHAQRLPPVKHSPLIFNRNSVKIGKKLQLQREHDAYNKKKVTAEK